METMTAKPGAMALNGISEASVRGRRPLTTVTTPQRQHQHQHQPLHQHHRHHHYQLAAGGMSLQPPSSGLVSPARQVSHSSSAGSLQDSEPPTPVFHAFVTPPADRSAFPFPPRPERSGPTPEPEPAPRHTEPEPEQPLRTQTSPKQPYRETEPKYALHGSSPGQPHLGADRTCSCQETVPKQRLRSESSGRFLYPEVESSPAGGAPRFPYPGSEPGSVGSQPGSVPSSAGGQPRYPYPGSESRYPDPNLPYAETEPKYVYQETEPKQAAHQPAGRRHYSETASPRPHCWLREAGRSRSEETHRLSAAAGPLPADACLDSDEAGGLSVTSDMRGVQADVRDSNHVHVGPKVFDQRNIHVARVDSHVDNLIKHEHVNTKQEHIQTKHEHVQNKTEVHNKTENIKYEHIQNKHEHIQWNTTEIVHNQAGTIYAERVLLQCDCKPLGDRRTDGKTEGIQPSPPSPAPAQLVEASRPFHEGYRFLATRYISFTALTSPLPWYDGMVLDIKRSCIDFSMVSMGGNSGNASYDSLEQLVREQQKRAEALRIIVEGHAGYGKTTLAARLAFDWARGADYLREYSHVFLIYLRELHGSLDEHIKTLHYPQERHDADAFLDYIKTNTERVLFIFDGYDEVPEEQRKPIDKIMSGLAYTHSGAVLTSRPMPMEFKKHCQFVGLVGFDEAKKDKFVRLVYGDRPQMRIEHFLEVLQQDRSMAELAQCPLMCLLLCEMHQRGKVGAGATKSQVYQELFQYLIGKAVHREHQQPLAEKSARLEATYHEVLAGFGAFCLQCLAADRLTFRKSDIPANCSTEMLSEIGFIVKCRNFSSKMCNEVFYEPIHKTFLEFLAAQYLHSINGEEDTLKRELLRLRQGTSRASERLILEYLCGLLKTEAWTIMDQLDVDAGSLGRDFLFSLLREAGESPQNVAAVCRRLPQERVTVRGSDNHLAIWALCLSSPASEVHELEFIWDVGSDRAGDAFDQLVAAQLGFWSALQSCANITDLRITFVYGESSSVPAALVNALCECMKHCARLARLAKLHIRAISPDNGADAFLPVISWLSEHVRSCTSLHQLIMDMNLSSEMMKRLCAGLAHVPRLQTLKLLRLFCNADGYDALAALIRGPVSIKTLSVSVALADGPTDLTTTSVGRLLRDAMDRVKKVGMPEQGLQRTGPDQELEHLRDVLGVNLKDERRVRVAEGVWCLVDQAGSRGLYPLPMCDQRSHKAGYHKLLKAVRCRGARLEHLTINQVSLSRMDFVCLSETIRKSESLTHLTLVDVAKAANLFPLITALPTAKRLENVDLRSQLIQMNDFLFFVFCRCLGRNTSLQELNIRLWKISLESASSMDHLRSLMKHTSLKRLVLAESRISLSCRLDEPAVFPCASLSSLDLSNCTIETASGAVLRGAALLPLLHGLTALKQLDLSDKAAPPLGDAAVKAFFGGLSSFKTLQELAICGWRYDVSSPETAYTETKAAAKKCGRLTTVRIDNSQFSPRSTECGKQWLVQAIATGVPHLQVLSLSSLSTAGAEQALRCALTAPQLDQLAKAIFKAKWTAHALRLFMPQLDSRLVDTFVELTRASSRIDVASDGRTVQFKRSRGAQWWPLRSR